MAPVLSAAIMDSFESSIEGAVWGFRFILMMSLVGLFWVTMAWMIAAKRSMYTRIDEDENKPVSLSTAIEIEN